MITPHYMSLHQGSVAAGRQQAKEDASTLLDQRNRLMRTTLSPRRQTVLQMTKHPASNTLESETPSTVAMLEPRCALTPTSPARPCKNTVTWSLPSLSFQIIELRAIVYDGGSANAIDITVLASGACSNKRDETQKAGDAANADVHQSAAGYHGNAETSKSSSV